MVWLRRFACVALLLGCGAQPAPAQDIAPDTPAQVVRRIAQAIWPENLFDSAGRPEPGFSERPSRPAYTDLRIVERGGSDARFRHVRIYAGHAYPGGCSHCGYHRRAVAQRDSVFISLLDAGDIELILPWAEPGFRATDSVPVRAAIVDLLGRTCLLGCDARFVRERDSLPEGWPLRPVDASAPDWEMPRTYSHVAGESLTLVFPVLTSEGLYRVQAQRDRRGGYNVLLTRVAHFGFGS